MSRPSSLQPRPNSRSPAHLPLYHRLLFPTCAPKQVPRLIDGEGKAIDEINEKLYNLIALSLRAYILSWYTRFTKDRTLLPSIHSTILHPLLHPVLQRAYDEPESLGEWVVLDLGTVVGVHVRVWNEARGAVAVFGGNVGDAYHARLPLPSVSPSPSSPGAPSYTLNPTYLSALANAIIPPNQPDVQQLMVREVLARAVLGGGLRRLSYGWFWYALILRFVGEPGDPLPWTSSKPPTDPKPKPKTLDQTILAHIHSLLSSLTALYTLLLSLFTLYTAAPPPPPQFHHCSDSFLVIGRELLGIDGLEGGGKKWGKRLVWGGVEMGVGFAAPLLDRIIPHLIQTRLTPELALRLLDLTERLLFPLDGYPGPSPIDPSPAEAADLRKRLENRLEELIPRTIRVLLLPCKDDISRLLDPISDAGCNAHLIGMVLDGVVGVLRPDLVVANEEKARAVETGL
ncbi:hypothetical protein I350_00151 [Cryptococcus amylolentus CBS 6273]|uniref:PXA domain-containing protein n=1 Tax=Cryptococcus amylolentus CBS 6273 TaxID=1296118 RepID=A0A1E3KGE7_9TREE|nr:hypothetical protein I350_00151 [Cryptococcus amylolentus CBS 6273]